MSETPKIAYVTKYALTSGIEARPILSDLAESTGAIRVQLDGQSYGIWLRKAEWSEEASAAIARAEEMRVAKIASLKKQIAKLEKLRFDVVDEGGEG